MEFDFATPVERRHPPGGDWPSQKWHRYGDDVLPLWVADMDLVSPPAVIEALRARVEHGVFGYGQIPDSLRETLFYPMVSGRAEGSGLGLSIAQSILHQHHGLIECESEPGHTQFRLLIPLEKRHD